MMTVFGSRRRARIGEALARLGACFGIALLAAFPGAGVRAGAPELPAKFVEPPVLAEQVAQGKLPPVEQRLPKVPAVADMPWIGQGLGKHGGELRLLMASAKDTRMMVVYGSARLVNYAVDFSLKPDMLESFAVEDGRSFTFHLRPGHKWSDGQPFTTEDFRYYWEDVANNPDLSPTGPPVQILVEGEAPKVEVIDETTIRYSWKKPNPQFLSALAGPSPLYIFRPSHYLKQYHAKYADAAKLAELVEKGRQQSWASLHNRMDSMYRNDNRDLPTLEPWMLVTKPPSKRFVFKRNPYYYRVDSQGRQLPYIDSVAMQIADSKLIPAKIAAGEADLAARYLRLDNFTLLKESEAHGNYKVLLWESGAGAQVTLFPNLNNNDPVWRTLLRDVRFRRALSLAIDRTEINAVIYQGLAIEGANAVLRQSPLYREEYQTAWASFDIAQANQLLDEISLTERSDGDVRLLPDGRPLEIIAELTGQSPEESDVLELIRDSWRKIGVNIFTKPSERDIVRNRMFAGDTITSVWTGLENGLPTADTAPLELAPTRQQQLQWPRWGQYVETAGQAGEKIDVPEPQRLSQLLKEWSVAPDIAEREAIWHEMLKIFTDQVYTIGTVAAVPQPVIIRNTLRNVPEQATYSWEPGAHFGIYKPDCFWLDEAS
jgi:peptide/nickel transport system substrate-binding protein